MKDCERCPDEHTSKCDTCDQELEPETMELTYTFIIKDGIYDIDGLHKDLDLMVQAADIEIIKSMLVSPDEETEHDYQSRREDSY